jgi:hypothetical protein
MSSSSAAADVPPTLPSAATLNEALVAVYSGPNLRMHNRPPMRTRDLIKFGFTLENRPRPSTDGEAIAHYQEFLLNMSVWETMQDVSFLSPDARVDSRIDNRGVTRLQLAQGRRLVKAMQELGKIAALAQFVEPLPFANTVYLEYSMARMPLTNLPARAHFQAHEVLVRNPDLQEFVRTLPATLAMTEAVFHRIRIHAKAQQDKWDYQDYLIHCNELDRVRSELNPR